MAANTANLATLSIAEINALLPTPNSTLTTDLSVGPYYDDYDKSKNFYRILYRPGYAVQARELTQSQTILQKQIDRFGKHVFREGSIVLPGEFSIETDVDYVKIRDVSPTNTIIDVTGFLNETITSNTGVTAYVIEVADGSEATANNTKTLFVRYTGASNNTTTKTFVDGETLTSNNGSIITFGSSATGKGSRFVIREGVFFAKEHFISFETQSIILDRYSITPNVRVGFQVLEELVRFTNDASLLDPALEASNYSAPGADRLKLTPVLTTKTLDDQEGAPDFVELFTIQQGIITELYDRPQYNILRDELAKRTVDESGDYYVRGLNVRIRENLDVNNNEGYDANGSSDLLSVGIEPGTGYVKGYEVNKIVTDYVIIPKSNTFGNVSSQAATATMGNYLVCDEFTGAFTHDQFNTILLSDRANDRLSNNRWASSAALGNTVGTARVKSIEYNSGTLGTPTGQVFVYVTDVKMNGTNSFATVRSISASNFGADLVLENGNAVLKDSALDSLLYYTGAAATRNVSDSTGTQRMDYDYKKTGSVSISAGTLTFTPSFGTNEEFPYGTTNLSTADKRDLILTVDSDVSISLGATYASNTSNQTFTVTGYTCTYLNVGDKILISNNTKPYFITGVTTNTITVSEILPPFLSGNTISKVYRAGDVIDLTTKGSATGAERTVAATPSQLTITLNETFTVSGKITYLVNVSNARQTQKLLRANAFVSIDCSTAGTTGPYSLGFSDVYKIRSIRKRTDGTIPTGTSDGTDATGDFIFDNGQRDAFYDIASIRPRSTLTSGTRLLVNLDYFEPSFTTGRGYYSVDSYPVNDTNTFDATTDIRTETIPVYTSPSSGFVYDLRNYIDFRPVKANTATYTTTPGSASSNPANNASFVYDGATSSLRFPIPSSRFDFDYSYYFSRIDVVVMDTEGVVSVIQGVPAAKPVTPQYSENTMALASIFVVPYPSLAPNYAQIINRPDLACISKKLANIRYTMRDIGVLKDRIVNLEYYASLNALQKDAMDMAILDEDGLNRFKNGIFVDTFSDHTFGDNKNSDYRIVVDSEEKSIRPVFLKKSIRYDYIPGESSGVTKSNSNILMLNYSEVPLLEQSVVTSYRNIELSSYRFIGNIYLDPDIDVWVETKKLADDQVSLGPTRDQLPQPVTQWNDWRKHVLGYYVDPQGPPVRRQDRDQWVYGGFFPNKPPNLIGSPNSPRDQRVVESAEWTRTGTQTTYGIKEDRINLGNKVVDVSLVPYIRGQIIDVNGKGFKARSRLYCFFDGENVADLCAPLTFDEYVKTPEQRAAEGFVPNYGGQIVTNDSGECWFALKLPADGQGKQFRVGQKEVVLTDSPTNSIDASTHGKNYFVAQGAIQQKNDTVLTTRTIVSNTRPLFERTTANTVVGYIDNPSCSAYSFIPKTPDNEEGTFLTSVDLWFARKHPTLGVWCEIRVMDTGGQITRTQVPFSEVWIEAADINLSGDGIENPTKISFPTPIFLYNNQQYAFVIHTVGLNPDTYFWISRLGEEDVNTGRKHNTRPLTGTFYTTNNNLNWNMVDDIDLRIRFNRAKFTSSSGTAIIANKPVEKFAIANTTEPLTSYGEVVFANRLELDSNTSYMDSGYYVVGQTSGANTSVLKVSGSNVTLANTRAKYTLGETVDIYTGSFVLQNTATITDVVVGSGVIESYQNYQGNTFLELISSNGKFTVGDSFKGSTSNTTADILSIDDYRYSVADFDATYLTFKKTFITFDMKPTSNAGVIGSYQAIIPGSVYEYDEEQAVLSRTNEVANLGGAQSNKVRINMSTTTEWLSPTFDLDRAQTILVDNFVNANLFATSSNTYLDYPLEAGSSGGELINKYISTVVTLAEGQDAEDILVMLTAYRPPTTDVLVWVKILNNEDSDLIANREWIPLERVTTTQAFSSLSDRKDFKEYTYRFPARYLTGPATVNSPGGEVQYTNSQGITYTGFKYFQVKIGLAATNSAVIPRVADLRTIALQI